MEAVAHLDTHVVAWLAAGDRRRLRPVLHRLRRGAIAISPVVFLELALLHEIGRLRERPQSIVQGLAGVVGLQVADAPFYEVCRAASEISWTRDPFDRLIVATASVSGARLITADSSILESFSRAVWA